MENKTQYKQIKAYSFYKNKETGSLYGMRVCDCRLIPDVQKAWERIRQPRDGVSQFESENFILIDFDDEVVIYCKK